MGKCKQCGRKFTWRDTRGKIYCSKECMSKDFSEKRMGEGNPRFNNGWRQYINKLNDINYCEKCLRDNIKLETHHLDGNDRNNNIANLIKLCRRCHMLVDGRFKNLNYYNSGTGLCSGDNDD